MIDTVHPFLEGFLIFISFGETDITSKNSHSQNKKSLPTIHVEGLCGFYGVYVTFWS